MDEEIIKEEEDTDSIEEDTEEIDEDIREMEENVIETEERTRDFFDLFDGGYDPLFLLLVIIITFFAAKVLDYR